MKEDYLWDKTGDDPEIERLEETLAVFRSRMDTPPLIVPDIAVNKKESASWFTGLRIAFAGMATAAAAVTIAAILIWYPTSKGELQATQNPAAERETVFVRPEVETPEVPAAKANEPVQVFQPGSKMEQPRTPRRHTPITRKTTVPAATMAKNETPVLTEEEKYAYNQLMLALSITNSKMKIVRDTMSGADLDHKTNHRTDKR
jgi:hypothetical protein